MSPQPSASAPQKQNAHPGVTVDPSIQQIFDAMATYMSANQYASMNCTASVTSAGTTQSVNCGTPGNANTFTYTQFAAGPRVSVNPGSASLGPAQTQQFTATAADADGNAIASPTFTWSVMGQGSIDANGLYTAPASVAANASDTCKCQLSGSQSFAQFTVALHP